MPEIISLHANGKLNKRAFSALRAAGAEDL